MYFKTDKLKNWSPQPQTLAGFERIRTVGKGWYNTFKIYLKGLGTLCNTNTTSIP